MLTVPLIQSMVAVAMWKKVISITHFLSLTEESIFFFIYDMHQYSLLLILSKILDKVRKN